MTSRNQFRKSATNKLRAAKAVSDAPEKLPVEVSYLCSVAMECALKRAILSRNQISRTEELPPDHQLKKIQGLFETKSGHDLERLRRAAGKSFEQCAAWKRLRAPTRPYSLRYNEEKVSEADSRGELAFVEARITELEEEQ